MQKSISTSIMVILLGALNLWMGCGVPTISVVEEAEHFFADVPRDPDHLYAAEIGQSEDKQMAIDTALDNARSEVARQFEARIEQYFGEAVDQPAVFSEEVVSGISKEVSSTCRVSRQQLRKKGSTYYAYVLMETPIEQANASLVARIKAIRDIYVRIIESRAFKELEEDLKEYEYDAEHPDYLHATGTGQSKDMQMAFDEAVHNARLEIAKQMNTRIQYSLEEAGVESKLVSKEITSATLTDCKVSKRDVNKKGSVYLASVQVNMPVKEVNAHLAAKVAKVKAIRDMYTRMNIGGD